MKIGIVTSHTSFKNNYGAVLQCYALCEQLKRWGVDPHVINYSYSNLNTYVDLSSRESHSVLNRIRYIFGTNANFVQKIQYRFNRKNRRKLESQFVEFYKKYIPLTSLTSSSYSEILENGFGYDGYITGSDQVWNPIIHGNTNDPCCFLQFSEPGALRIAYAPSFGISYMPDNCKDGLVDYINSFDFVSVREQSGQKIIADLMGIEFPVVLDPTMMADAMVYDPISKLPDTLPPKYILCYRFGRNKLFDEMAKQISKKLKLPLVELPLSIEAYGKNSLKSYSIGPAAFIGSIKGADLVLTDSYHCSVFSILNHKKFYVFLRQSSQDDKNMNSRLLELLGGLGLDDRLICSNDDAEKIDVCNEIDYCSVDKLLEEKRKKSQEYLKTALNINKNNESEQ